MAAADPLSEFVRAALSGGHDRPRIRSALEEQGWSAPEIETALGGWADGGGLPPVPRPRPSVSAREAVLYALLMIALVLVCFHVLRLGFHVIDEAIPDLAEPAGPDAWSMRFSIAAIIAFLPLYVGLDHRMARRTGGRGQQRRSQARRVFASVTVHSRAVTTDPAPIEACPMTPRLAGPFNGAPYRIKPLAQDSIRRCAGFEVPPDPANRSRDPAGCMVNQVALD